jgi:hypothetical protein
VITKAERAELRSLIRQRFKVLRAEVEARRAELEAELESHIAARYAGEDKAWSDAMYLIDEAVREANRKANDLLRGLGLEEYPADREYSIVRAAMVAQPLRKRSEWRRQGDARIAAQVKGAYLRLDREEADLLTRLVQGALESEEARAFLGEIPTVSALVPAVRLAELEQSLNGGDGGRGHG